MILKRRMDSSLIYEGRERSNCSFIVPDEMSVLRGHYSSKVGGNMYSRATGKWYR